MHSRQYGAHVLCVTALCVIGALFNAAPLAAQSGQLTQRLAEIKRAAARNKEALARYTWKEQETISIRGQVRKQELYQVRLGPDGKPEKTLVSGNGAPSGGGGGRFKQRIVQRKTEEYESYAKQIAALAQSYAQPDPLRLQQAYQNGNVTLRSGGGAGTARVRITSYVKPNDSVAIVFDTGQKSIKSLQIASYLDSPDDVVNISAQYSKLPDGTNHVSTMTVNGVSKQLLIQIQNANYEKL